MNTQNPQPNDQNDKQSSPRFASADERVRVLKTLIGKLTGHIIEAAKHLNERKTDKEC